MSARPLDDDAAREPAVTTFDRNVVVVAGAGTGKTSLLVERLLVAVGRPKRWTDEGLPNEAAK